MASPVDISNTALAHVGAENQIASIDPPDGSVEAGYCARFYPIARRQALEEAAPRWAQARVALAEVDNASTVWAYAYAKPANCLKPLRVLDLTWSNALLFREDLESYSLNERNSADYVLEGEVIYTNQPEAVLVYIQDVTDSSKFSAQFTAGLAMLLAGYIAGPIIKGREGMSVGTAWTQAAQNALSRAAASDANANSERSDDQIPDSIRARQ